MHLHSSPAYSMSTKINLEHKNLVPGPGHYDQAVNRDRLPSWKIGTQQRKPLEKSDTPGPGTYQNKTLITQRPGISLKSRHADLKLSETPGPGSYQPHFNKIQKSEPSYKLPTDKKLSQSQPNILIPGPGTYEANSTINPKTGNKFGTERRDTIQINKDLPGPGKYYDEKHNNSLFSSFPKVKFGTSERKSVDLRNTPGPGTYDKKTEFQTQLQKKKGFSMSLQKRYSLAEIKNVPGPGAYDNPLNKVLRHTPSYTIGNFGKNQILKISDTPSPLTYNINQSTQQKQMNIVFGTSNRTLNKESKIPGPGSYEQKNVVGNEGPKFSITRSRTQEKSLQYPGPGQYNPPILAQKDAQVSIGKQPRIIEQKKIGPGPGGYEVISTNNKKGVKIGNQKRSDNKKSDTPGPGHYQTPSGISNLPKYVVNS